MTTDAESAHAQAEARDAGRAATEADTFEPRETAGVQETPDRYGTREPVEGGEAEGFETPARYGTRGPAEAAEYAEGEDGYSQTPGRFAPTEPAAASAERDVAVPEPATSWEPAADPAATAVPEDGRVPAAASQSADSDESAGAATPYASAAPAAPGSSTSATAGAYGAMGTSAGAGAPAIETNPVPALAPETAMGFRERWHEIQASFVDSPHQAVEEADQLVADIARAFAEGVETRRRALSSAWQREEHRETEDLRLTLRQYRALADHILGR